MAQIFHRSFNTIAKVSLFGALLFVGAVAWVCGEAQRSPWVTDERVVREQPIPFSHKHHVADDGIDCRYCHASVETSRFAGMPSTKTCMSCHSQIFASAPILEPIRESWRLDRSIEWTRVHDLPDFAYFDHSIHVARGVGCETCHGRVDQMPLTWREQTLEMRWCLDCHRRPERHVRPRDQVFAMGWDPQRADPPTTQEQLGRALVAQYAIHSGILSPTTNCSVCHR